MPQEIINLLNAGAIDIEEAFKRLQEYYIENELPNPGITAATTLNNNARAQGQSNPPFPDVPSPSPSFLDVPAMPVPARGAPPGATLGQRTDPSVIDLPTIQQPSQQDVFRRFVANMFAGQAPGLGRAATNLLPLASAQFALQQPRYEKDFAGGPFAQFLGSRQALMGPELQARLGQLAGGLQQEAGAGIPFTEPALQTLTGRFLEPESAFSAFSLPSRQQTSPAFRGYLEAAQKRAFDRFLGTNPNATALDVARLFGF